MTPTTSAMAYKWNAPSARVVQQQQVPLPDVDNITYSSSVAQPSQPGMTQSDLVSPTASLPSTRSQNNRFVLSTVPENRSPPPFSQLIHPTKHVSPIQTVAVTAATHHNLTEPDTKMDKRVSFATGKLFAVAQKKRFT